jgi:hypothetical protein
VHIDLQDVLPSLAGYRASIIFMVVQLSMIRMRHASEGSPASVACRPSSMTCFLPVLVWGIESVFHAHRAMLGPSRFCFGVPVWAFAQQGLLSALVGFVLLCGGFLSENWARRAGWPVRRDRAGLPLGVVAALASVQLVWCSFLMAYLPHP